jgi:hypothetical protein
MLSTLVMFAACGGDSGWTLPQDAVVPPHPELVYQTESYNVGRPKQKISVTATIDGKVVKATLKQTISGSLAILTVDIASTKTGKLVLAWGKDTQFEGATFTIAKSTRPKQVTATTSRYHVAYSHSTVHELEDGLEVRTDAQAVRFVASWRRDAQSTFASLQVPALTRDGHQVMHLGEIGCETNFSVPLLESGIELQVSAVLSDGTTLPVTGLPARVVLPKLPAGADQSSP